MEVLWGHILEIVGFLVVALSFIIRNKEKMQAIYKHAETAFWFAEEVAVQHGIVKEDKVKAFIDKFKKLMKEDFYWVTEKNIQLALDIARAFCAKYRDPKKSEEKKEAAIVANSKVMTEEEGMRASVQNSPEEGEV